MSGRLDKAQLEALVASGEIDTVVAAFTDMQGRLIGKRCTGRFFLDAVHEEWHACNYLLTVDMEMEPVPGFKAASWDKGYGDFVIKPDLGTLRRIPWLPGTALVLGDVSDHHGDELPHSPRTMLKRQLAAAEGSAATPPRWPPSSSSTSSTTAIAAAREKHYRDLKTAGWYIEDYHVLETTKREPLMRAIRNGMEAAGIPVQESKGEWGPGQEELNLVYAEALEMADRHVIYKNGVKEIAWLQGKAVSFMAKWRADLAGNSCHIHGSLWDADDRPAFSDGKGETELFRQFLAGLLAVGGEMTYFLAPYVNSYKRFQSPARSRPPTWSGAATTALAASGCWAMAPATRIECRVGGADVNPYLAFAAFLAAGPARDRAGPGAAAGVPGRRLQVGRRALGAGAPCTTRSTASSARRCCARPSATRWSSTMSMPGAGSRRSTTRRSPTGS